MTKIRHYSTLYLIEQCIPHLVYLSYDITSQLSLQSFIKYIPQFKKLREIELSNEYEALAVDQLLQSLPQVSIPLHRQYSRYCSCC